MWDLLQRRLNSTLGILLILASFLLFLEIRSPRFFCWDDNATQFSGYYNYNYDAIVHQKTFPWMVWTQYAGQTNLTQSQSGVFYLPAYISTALSWKIFGNPFWTIDLLIMLHLLFGAYGMIRYLRQWNLPNSIIHPAALLYATTPFFIIVSRSWIFVTYSMAYTPWLFLLVDRLLERPNKRDFSFYILLKSLFFFQGYSHVWINLSFIEGLYFLWRWVEKNRSDQKIFWKSIAQYLLLQLLHLLVISPQLLINIQSVQDSPYRGGTMSLDQLLAFRLDLPHAFLAQFFLFTPEYYLLSSTMISFFGGSLLLFFLGYHHFRSGKLFEKQLQAPLLFLLLTLLLSTSAYQILHTIPPFNILRWPIKFMMILPFFYAIFFASLLQQSDFFRSTSPWRSRWLWICAGLQITLFIFSSTRTYSPFSHLRYEGWSDFKLHWSYDGGRVVSTASDDRYLEDPQLLTYNYGTWAGIPELGGYDQLVSKANSKIALGMQLTSALPIHTLNSHHDHLNQWGVRYITASPQDPDAELLNSIPWLQKTFQNNRLLLFENKEALPLITFSSTPTEPLNYKRSPNSLIINLQGKTGTLVVRFAALRQLFYRYKNGDEISKWQPILSNPDLTMRIPIQNRCDEIEISYRPSTLLSASFTLSLVFLILLCSQFITPKKQ